MHGPFTSVTKSCAVTTLRKTKATRKFRVVNSSCMYRAHTRNPTQEQVQTHTYTIHIDV